MPCYPRRYDRRVPHEPAAAMTTHEIIDAARVNVDDDVWDYIEGGAETETTARRNRLAIDSLALRPRVLRDVSSIDTGSTLLGHPLRIPVVLAPIGALETITADGGIASARAAERFGVLPIISSVTEPGLEAVGAATAAPKVSQLYIRGDAAWADELIGRVLEAGYVAIALTVDSAYYGRRERQLRSGWRPPTHRSGPEPGIVWQARLTWEWLEQMRNRAGVPMIVKGIQTARDAEIAVERGFEVIYVSNHGGRELDHAEAGIETLREVVDAVAGRAEIVVDGGFMRGTDVLKAIALGANAVGLGRLQGFALAAGGEAALFRVLELLEEEIRIAMGLVGVVRLDELDPSFVRESRALPAPSALLAAFAPRPTDWPAGS
jgi:isopentenyl diphosphate isomerase/L-lactate dehydrogenase-like FMN-dependent dehydrogenase